MQTDSNELIAYVMKHNQMSQAESMDWLDKWVPDWRKEPPPKTVGIIYYDGSSDEHE